MSCVDKSARWAVCELSQSLRDSLKSNYHKVTHRAIHLLFTFTYYSERMRGVVTSMFTLVSVNLST